MTVDRLERAAFSLRHGHVVTVAVPPDLTPALLCLFPDDQVDVPDAEPDLTLREVGPGWLQLNDANGPLADPVETRGEGLGQLEFMLAEYLVGGDAHRRILHAGGALVDGSALLLSGHGGSGKSTITAALALRGLPVFGDDVVSVDLDTGLVSPIRRLLKIMEEPRRALGILRKGTPLDDLWPEAVYLHPSDLGSTWAEAAPVGLLTFPTWSGDPLGDATAVEIPGAAAMQRILFQLLLIERHGPDEVDLVARLLEDARTFEVQWGDGHRGANLLIDLLRRSRQPE